MLCHERDSLHAQNIKINNAIGGNEKYLLFHGKSKRTFWPALYVPVSLVTTLPGTPAPQPPAPRTQARLTPSCDRRAGSWDTPAGACWGAEIVFRARGGELPLLHSEAGAEVWQEGREGDGAA